MPNKTKINDNELGYIEKRVGKARSQKLILDQNNKTEYLAHYRMLKFYVKMCVTVTKIPRVIKFRKLMNNLLYGKICMDPQHFLQSKFLHDEEKIMENLSKPTLKNLSIYKDYSQIEYINK